MGIEYASLIQILFYIDAMRCRNTMGPLANLQVKPNGCKKQNIKRFMKKRKIFSNLFSKIVKDFKDFKDFQRFSRLLKWA
jgi:hypothetical protein